MTCPKCGARMKWRTIMGSRWCDKVESATTSARPAAMSAGV